MHDQVAIGRRVVERRRPAGQGQTVEDTGIGGRVEPKFAPQRCDGVAHQHLDLWWQQRRHRPQYRQCADAAGDRRSCVASGFVDDRVRRELSGRRQQVVDHDGGADLAEQARREPLRAAFGSDTVAWSASGPGGQTLEPGDHRQPDACSREWRGGELLTHIGAGSEDDMVSCRTHCLCQRQQRVDMPARRNAGDENSHAASHLARPPKSPVNHMPEALTPTVVIPPSARRASNQTAGFGTSGALGFGTTFPLGKVHGRGACYPDSVAALIDRTQN